MNYFTFEISIAAGNGLKFLEVVAVGIEAARADVVDAYGADVEIVSVRCL